MPLKDPGTSNAWKREREREVRRGEESLFTHPLPYWSEKAKLSQESVER